ncbi:MAG: hypothetical protein H6661_05290 [Ardenticatenaceae bacterium]|nr:hypothetical protein [Ardenticatenaceae bacterium]
MNQNRIYPGTAWRSRADYPALQPAGRRNPCKHTQFHGNRPSATANLALDTHRKLLKSRPQYTRRRKL